jgi:hypothetical protein
MAELLLLFATLTAHRPTHNDNTSFSFVQLEACHWNRRRTTNHVERVCHESEGMNCITCRPMSEPDFREEKEQGITDNQLEEEKCRVYNEQNYDSVGL